MGFKMRSGNKTAFKEMGSSEGSPLEIGKWTGMMANKQKFIGDEIQARRKAKGDKEDDEEDKKGKTDKTTPKNDPPKNDPPKDQQTCKNCLNIHWKIDIFSKNKIITKPGVSKLR